MSDYDDLKSVMERDAEKREQIAALRDALQRIQDYDQSATLDPQILRERLSAVCTIARAALK